MSTLILTRADVAALLPMSDCISAVEDAFRQHAMGRSLPPAVLGVPVPGGGFHIKTAGLTLAQPYFAAKLNANFPDNPTRRGLPTIQGVVMLSDPTDGRMLALMDSIEITALRTAAATAVAAKYLARPDARVAAIVGCGVQGRVQLRALREVVTLTRVLAFDADRGRAAGYAEEMSAALGLSVSVAPSIHAAAHASDIVVTCTSSRSALLGPGDVRPGTFIAAVGADNEHKQELEPRLMAASTIVVDVLEQCATIGDLHHAIAAGAMTRDQVHAELGQIVAGQRVGRATAEETIVFDSTGTAIQDVAAAAMVYERARASGRGITVELNSVQLSA